MIRGVGASRRRRGDAAVGCPPPMRPLARPLFTFCSAVSLLVCVALCLLWARSYWRRDVVYVERREVGPPLDRFDRWAADHDSFGWPVTADGYYRVTRDECHV